MKEEKTLEIYITNDLEGELCDVCDNYSKPNDVPPCSTCKMIVTNFKPIDNDKATEKGEQ